MDTFFRLLTLTLASHLVRAGPLTKALQEKSDAYMAYASDFSDRYEPIAFAAVSLHPPMPVLHIISPNPMSMNHNALASAMSNAYTKPYSRPYAPYVGYERGYNRGFNPGYGPDRGYDQSPEQSHRFNTILYARPDKYGGYTYYRKTKNTPKKPNKISNRPVILRIHKYRIVRDR